MMMMFGSVLTAFLLEAVKRGLKMLFPLEKHKHLKMEHGDFNDQRGWEPTAWGRYLPPPASHLIQ